MGEAARKKRGHAAILEKDPWCIYCGHAATTIEHMPSIQMFRQRQRPKGLEFPACFECNNGTGKTDLVASLMGRVYPDSKDDAQKDELRKLLRAVSKNVPGLIEEMMIGRAGQKFASRSIPNMPVGAAVLRANGPILSGHMHVFGAKLGFALHYEAHGARVPEKGGVQSMYFTNVSAARGELPRDIIDLLPSPRTLKQGKKEVSEQFTYSWLLTEEQRHSVFYAVFNDSFAVAAVTAIDRNEFLARNADKFPVWSPGDFKARKPSPGA